MNMDYHKIYDNLVRTRKERVPVKDEHYENHHIVMKSMGGSDEPENLVKLTPREHFLAHILLWEIHRNWQTSSAFQYMSDNKRYKVSSRMYEESRKAAMIANGYNVSKRNFADWAKLSSKERSEKVKLTLIKNLTPEIRSKNTTESWLKKTFTERSEILKKSASNRDAESWKQNLSKSLKGKLTGTVWITNGRDNKRVKLSDLKTYLSQGWMKGRRVHGGH